MNKKEFSILLSKKIDLKEEEVLKVMEIFERYFFLRKSARKDIIRDLILDLNFNEIKAAEVYTVVCSLIKTSLKESIKHPFRSKD